MKTAALNITGTAVLLIDFFKKYLAVCCILNADSQVLGKLLKIFINLKTRLLISVYINEAECVMGTEKSLLILHAV